MWTVDNNGYYGQFGGAYIPEMLYKNVENLKRKLFKNNWGSKLFKRNLILF